MAKALKHTLGWTEWLESLLQWKPASCGIWVPFTWSKHYELEQINLLYLSDALGKDYWGRNPEHGMSLAVPQDLRYIILFRSSITLFSKKKCSQLLHFESFYSFIGLIQFWKVLCDSEEEIASYLQHPTVMKHLWNTATPALQTWNIASRNKGKKSVNLSALSLRCSNGCWFCLRMRRASWEPSLIQTEKCWVAQSYTQSWCQCTNQDQYEEISIKN